MLKRTTLVLVILMLCGSVVQAETWALDRAHSSVQFKVSHLVISKVVGWFGEFSGSLEFDGQDVTTAGIEMVVKVASIDTGSEDRDKHLLSGDFFYVAKYPEMSFKSAKVVRGEGSGFQLVGNLTINGITREVTFDCDFHGSAEFMGITKAGFTAGLTIDRQDYGVSWNRTLEAGGVVVGNEVEITLELEFNQAD